MHSGGLCGAAPRRRRARAQGPAGYGNVVAIRRAVSASRSVRAGVLASPRTARRGHVVEPAVRGRGCSRGRLRGVPLSAPSRAVGAGRPRLALRAPRPCDTPTTQHREASGDRRPPPTAGGHEPRGCASRVPSVVLPPSGLAGGRAAPRESFDSHCSRDCQQARRWCSSRLRPGACRAALQPSARFPRYRPSKNRYVYTSRRRIASRPTEGGGAGAVRGGGGRGGGRRLGERGAARRGPRRPTIQTAPLRSPPRASRTRTASTPHRARGASLISPTSVNWLTPPRAERGSDLIYCAAIKQLTTAGGPYAGARSSFHGVPDSQQRVARAPAAAPTAARRTPAITDRQYRHPLAGERTQPENS